MYRRLWLICALTVSPTWSQEAAAPSAPAFDLRSAAVQQIVRDTAATQSAQVQHHEAAPAKRPALASIDFSTASEALAPAPRRATPRPAAAPPAASSNGFLSALVDIVIDEVLFDGRSDASAALSSARWLRCQARDRIDPGIGLWETCPQLLGGRLVPIGDPPTGLVR